MKLVFPVILGYVLGSVPIGFLVAHYWGHIDIRHYGSGNIGTTNVFRTLGFYPGSIVLIGDIGKGVIAVLLGKWLGGEQAALLAGLAAILGHSWSIFLSFKGGRGVATGAGVFLALTPKVILIAALIWILVIAITGYVSLGSIIAAGSLPILMLIFRESSILLFFACIAVFFVIYRHRPNIKRLLEGTEHKFRIKPMK
ncbi:MAG TPA: glycerol-3-phosphate 1-O-acyltransferase PlsY [Clostridia bacterium]|nr:glycerol-3-phosphate 1-O-acyltransferase PlsY [Clostridia bacterium]